MKPILIVALLTAGLAASSSAMALERSTTTNITLDNGTVVATTDASFDRDTGVFSRTGEVELANGTTFTFEVSGKCLAKLTACEFVGSAVGPMGGDWSIAGSMHRGAETASLAAEVTAPNGRKFTIERNATGDMPIFDRVVEGW